MRILKELHAEIAGIRGLGISILAWFVLSLVSIVQYKRISNMACYFGTSWLGCSPVTSNTVKAVFIIALCAIFLGLIIGGYRLWNNQKNFSGYKKWVALLAVLACTVVPFGSGDMTFYYSSGKAAYNGINVFTEDWPTENNFVFPPAKRFHERFSYGPVMAHIFSALYAVSGGNALVFILIWKMLMAGVLVGCAALVLKIIGEKYDSSHKIFLWLAQPFLLFEWVVNGHFDGLWLLTVLLAVLCANKKMWWPVFPLLALGIWMKFIPAFVVPWFVLWWWQEVTKENWRKLVGELVVGALLTAAVTVGTWFTFWDGFGVFGAISMLSKWAVGSLFSAVYYTLQPIFVKLFQAQSHRVLTTLVHGFVFGIFVYLLYPLVKDAVLIMFKRKKWLTSNYIAALFISLAVYLMVWQKAVWPWYFGWVIPFGMLMYFSTNNQLVKKVTRWISVSPLVMYPVWYINWLLRGVDGAGELWYFWVMVLTIMAYPLYNLFIWRKKNYNQD